MRFARISFSLLLPLAELVIWAVLIPIPAARMYYRLHQANRNLENASIGVGQFEVRLHRNRLAILVIGPLAARHFHSVFAANLPGEFGEILISLPTSSHLAWHPAALPMNSWLPLIVPFSCLPAWWLVGLGLDGLSGRRRLHRKTILTGSAFFFLFLFFLLVFLVGVIQSTAAERVDLDWLFPGLLFWTIAFGVLPLNWWRQRQSLRADSRSASAA